MNRCQICPNNCFVDKSICGRRIRMDENMVEATAVAMDPVEKKPLYHFMPGSKTLSVGTLGCNLKCLNCQNHDIAQPEHPSLVPVQRITPESIVKIALENHAQSISWTYNEASIYPEWIANTAKIAQKENIRTILVSNGYTSQKTLNDLTGYVDAVNIDLKSISDGFYREICGGKVEPVLNAIRHYNDNGVHCEVTNLLIPGLNDDEDSVTDLVKFIKTLSDDVVLHFSAFFPQFKLTHLPPTGDESVLEACSLAKSMGLKNVYPGNTHPSPDDNTYCEDCGEVLIEREYYDVKNNITGDKRCPSCNKRVKKIIM